jgi:hypothetical protein
MITIHHAGSWIPDVDFRIEHPPLQLAPTSSQPQLQLHLADLDLAGGQCDYNCTATERLHLRILVLVR